MPVRISSNTLTNSVAAPMVSQLLGSFNRGRDGRTSVFITATINAAVSALAKADQASRVSKPMPGTIRVITTSDNASSAHTSRKRTLIRAARCML